ncbi:MAG TPA: FecR domain-containing protein [Mucilaginibacter sp.]|nr:FecR domain-containing protein [Mucilaginibacter sp.]
MEDRYQELAKKWLDKTITRAEEEEFAAWYNADQNAPVFIPPAFAENEDELRKRILYKIRKKVNKDRRSVKIIPAWVFAAAALLLLAFGVIWYRIETSSPVKQQLLSKNNHKLKNDIGPGGNKAVLTLANGNKINLNDVKNGVLGNQGQSIIKKDSDGRVTYETTTGKHSDASMVFNTITIPNGGQYRLTLSDGSKVWLNAASSITFPVAFSKNERKVTVTGEAYFEVAKNKKWPFIVIAGKQTVQVLGTHFDVNAYADENTIKTTLVEGSVKVSVGTETAILKPEEQSVVSDRYTGKIAIQTVDTDDVLAWTTGNFQFERAEISSIMREAARWYDVEIKYDGEVPHRIFTGSISRNVNLSELLNMLKYTGINFKIEGNTIIVTS